MKTPLQIFILLLAAATFAVATAGETPAPETKPESTTPPRPQPQFPLTSANFANIDDDKVMPAEGLPEATSYNVDALLDILPAVQDATQETLKANVDPSATFIRIFNHPSEYRGHVVQFESTVKFLYKNPQKVPDKIGTVHPLVMGHVTSTYQHITFLSLEPLPKNLKLNDSVLVTGVFLQRFAYVNSEMPGMKLTWTPLVLVKRLEPITIKEEAPSNPVQTAGYIIFAMVTVGLILMYGARQNRRNDKSNVFTKLKNQKDGGGHRLFPSGNSRKK